MVVMIPPADEPPRHLGDARELLVAYLDHYRDTVLRKLAGLGEAQLRASRLPSGWTPLELVEHLRCMERRWFEWGFAGEAVDRPWGEQGPDGRWWVAPDEPVDAVVGRFTAQRARSARAVGAAPLARRARTGGRFATEADAPTLGWIMLHVLQEYARHVGQLDVARELLDGAVGE